MAKDICIRNETDQIIPNFTITCVIIRFMDNKLEVLLQQSDEDEKGAQDFWVLPQNYIKTKETSIDSVQRLLQGKHSYEIGFLDQFRTFEEFNKNSKQTGLTIGYCALVRQNDNESNNHFLDYCKWFKFDELPDLCPSHGEILNSSLKYLNTLIRFEPVVFILLPKKFTLLKLMCLYEQILRVEIDKSNFRRKILSMNLLEEFNEKQQDVSHRAAKFYGFDLNRYQKKKENVFSINF